MQKTSLEVSFQKFLFLSLAEGMICFLYYLLIPGGEGTGAVFQFSPVRLLFLFLVLLLVAGLCLLAFQKKFQSSAVHAIENGAVSWKISFGSWVLIFVLTAFLRTADLLYRTTGKYLWHILFLRSFPLILLLGGIGFQFFLLTCCVRKNELKISAERRKRIRKIFWILLCIGIAAGVFIGITKIGLVKENAFWGKPTIPLLEWQMIAAGLLGWLWMTAEFSRGRSSLNKFSRFFPLLIWLFAVIIWTSIPNQKGFFSPPGREPNYEIYPFSDASAYGHYARSVAAGMGYKNGQIPPRIFYVAVLGLFHLIARNQYDLVIFLQILLLALLPVILYQIGKEIHSISAGIMAAWFVIFREINAIMSAPFAHNDATVKYFLADVPTALAASFFTLMFIRWLKDIESENKNSWYWAILSGCTLGIMTLIRTQSFVLIIPALIPLFLKFRNKKVLWKHYLVFALSLGVMLMPWLVRNYKLTGKFVFDDPLTQTAELTRNYNFENADLSQHENENDGDYTVRMKQIIRRNVLKNPGKVFSFAFRHFFNNEICNLRLFPLRSKLDSLENLIKINEPFWEVLENGNLQLYNLIFLGLGFIVIVFGVSAASRKGFMGIAPFLFNIIFNFGTGVGRYSGGRYLIPLDWVIFLYFAVGLAEIFSFADELIFFNKEPELSAEETFPISSFPKRKMVVSILITLAAASLIPVMENLIPMHFKPATEKEVLDKFGVSSFTCSGHQTVILKALSAYPRYYHAGEGEPESAKQGYGVSDYGRLIFLGSAPNGFGTFELKTEETPGVFPDGSEVWILACENVAVSEVKQLIVETPKGEYTYIGNE